MDELASRVEHHFRFSRKELFQLSMTALVAGFGLTLSQGWGLFNLFPDENIPSYFANLAVAFCFCWIAIFIHFSAQKVVALNLGYSADYSYWMNGFLISTMVCFVTFGFIPLFFTGSAWLEVQKKLRMGRFRQGVMHKDVGFVSFAGPFTSMIIAAALSPFYLMTQNSLLFSFIVINLLVGLYSLIPVPTFEKVRQVQGGTTGLYLFISSRWVFVLVATTFLVYALMIMIAQLFSIIIAFLIGALTAFLYYRAYE